MIVDDDLHDLSLPGPVAVDFLAKHVPGNRDLKYFPSYAGDAVRPSRDDFATGYTASAATRSFCKG